MDGESYGRAERLCLELELLQGRGYTVRELAERYGVSACSITRDMQLLRRGLCGLKADNDGGRWRVVTMGGQVAGGRAV